MSGPNQFKTVIHSSLPIEVERLLERNRQEKETFDQRKRQDKQWFILKLIMGFSSILMLFAVLVIAAYILFNNEKYPNSVVVSAGAALFIDIVGLITSVWKIVLNSNSIAKFEPITKLEIKSKSRTIG